MPSGSVLSRKCGCSRSPRPPSASATSCGPSAEPPMPITSTCRKRSAAGREHAAVVDARREVQHARLRLADGRGDLRRGRPLRGAQPVVADHPLLVGVGEAAPLERLHRRERLRERRPRAPRAPARRAPCGSGRAGTRARARRAAASCSSPRARVRSSIRPPPGILSSSVAPGVGASDTHCEGNALLDETPAAARRFAPGLVRGRGLADRRRPAARRRSASANCTTLGQCSFVRDALQQYYYWYRELPNADPASFSSPEAYLDAVRYRTLDSTFSYITSKASSDAFFSDSQFIGFGLSYKQTGDLELRAHADLSRAARRPRRASTAATTWLSVNGKPVADLIRTGEIATVFGPEQVGVTAEIAWRAPGGPERRATLAKRLVTIPTVSQTAVFASGSARVGYIHFRNFVAALRRRAQHRLPAAARPGRDRARARRALQRRRARLGGAAPGGPDRRPAARGPGVRAVHPQRQADEPQHGLPLREPSRRRSASAGWW